MVTWLILGIILGRTWPLQKRLLFNVLWFVAPWKTLRIMDWWARLNGRTLW